MSLERCPGSSFFSARAYLAAAIDAAFRGQGIGQALRAYLADVALQNQCGRFEWMVLDWNHSAIAFYERLGATVLTDWRVCRVDEAQLSRVASRLVVATNGG